MELKRILIISETIGTGALCSFQKFEEEGSATDIGAVGDSSLDTSAAIMDEDYTCIA